MPETSLDAWCAAHGALIARVHEESGASRWGVPHEQLGQALFQSVRYGVSAGAGEADERRYLASLHVADLALACALRHGHEAAWDHFVLTHRPDLYAAARSIAGEDHRELADSIYAELIGVSQTGAARTSLLAWYHGRSRLTTWLRSVLVQRQIDARRRRSRLEPLEETGEDAVLAVAAPDTIDPDREQYVALAQDAVDRATAALDFGARLRLRLYYGEDLTLAQIGRVTGEHEATVSRKLNRARRELKRLIERILRTDHGLSPAAIARCLECAAEAPELHLTRLLSRAEDG